MSRENRPTHVGAMCVGAMLATLVTVVGVVTGSAAHLDVDGGVLQSFAYDAPPIEPVDEAPDHQRQSVPPAPIPSPSSEPRQDEQQSEPSQPQATPGAPEPSAAPSATPSAGPSPTRDQQEPELTATPSPDSPGPTQPTASVASVAPAGQQLSQ